MRVRIGQAEESRLNEAQKAQVRITLLSVGAYIDRTAGWVGVLGKL